MVKKGVYGELSDGKQVNQFTIYNSEGEHVTLLDYGATIHSVYIKDSKGNLRDVVLGAYDAADLEDRPYAGSTIGRCANRIAYGRFEIHGKQIQLECNRNGHFLHGASGNYAHKLFRAEVDEAGNGVDFYLNDKGEGGFDCSVEVKVRFSFDDKHRLEIFYDMAADGDTVLCPTNHAYFNLTGSDIREHDLQINSVLRAKNGDSGVPEGESVGIKNTRFDFSTLRNIGEALASSDKGISIESRNYDDCYILEKEKTDFSAKLISSSCGRTMTVYTDMPAIILFTPPPDRHKTGKNGRIYEGYCAVCLETQFVPNAVNCPQFDSPIFAKGSRLFSRTVYEFGVLPEQ